MLVLFRRVEIRTKVTNSRFRDWFALDASEDDAPQRSMVGCLEAATNT